MSEIAGQTWFPARFARSSMLLLESERAATRGRLGGCAAEVFNRQPSAWARIAHVCCRGEFYEKRNSIKELGNESEL